MAVQGRAAAPLTGRDNSTWQKAAVPGRNPKSANLVSLLRTHLPIASVIFHLLPSSATFCRYFQFGRTGTGREARPSKPSGSCDCCAPDRHEIPGTARALRGMNAVDTKKPPRNSRAVAVYRCMRRPQSSARCAAKSITIASVARTRTFAACKSPWMGPTSTPPVLQHLHPFG